MKETLHIYRRVSSDIQAKDGDSLNTQLAQGKQKADSLGYSVKDWNEGSVSSASEDITKRPVMLRLLHAIDEGKVKHLYAFHTDRLSRNEDTWHLIRTKIKERGVTLHTNAGTLDLNSPQDNFIAKIMGAHAQYENEIRRLRSVLGKEQRVRNGGFTGGLPNFGYKSVDKKYAIDKESAKWVKKIYSMFAEGKSIKQIATFLESNNVKPPRSNRWNLMTLDNLLGNKIYTGQHEWKGIPVATPQIVSHSLFDRVQKIRNSRSGVYKNNRSTHFYLLGGLLECGSCGSTLWGHILEHKQTRLYVCPSKHNNWRGLPKTKCKNTKNINLDKTNELVWETVIQTVGSSSFMKEKFKKEILQLKNENIKSSSADLKKLDGRLKKAKGEENRTLDAISMVEVERLQQRMEQVTYQLTKDRLTQELNKTRNDIARLEDEISIKNDEKKWVDWVSRFGLEIEKTEKLNDEEKRDYLTEVISKIEVHQTKDKSGHTLIMHFKQPIVGDGIKYLDEKNKRKGYKLTKGKKVSKLEDLVLTNRGRPKKKNEKNPSVEPIQQSQTLSYRGVSLSFVVEVTSNQLWNTRYSDYQSFLHNTITDLHCEGLGYRKIAKRLNEMGIKTARDKVFYPASVHSILKKKKIRDERINKKFEKKISSLELKYDIQ